jgi:2-polyprenyl-6-methoxyphenol hydroxylase-like FAD-dependent oxidoreductase
LVVAVEDRDTVRWQRRVHRVGGNVRPGSETAGEFPVFGNNDPRVDDIAVDLVIGTDGRYSTVRKRGAFTEPRSPQHFDVLNFMVPFPDFWPDRTTVRLELGPGCLTGGIPTADGRLWVGMTIQKGQYKALRAAGPDGLTAELLRRTSPDLAAHLRANAEALKEAGVNCHFYVSPQTAHEWLSWRRDLHEFAPLLFQN